MSKKIVLVYFILLILGIDNESLSQEVFRSNKWVGGTLNARTFSRQSYGYQIFSYLGINNNKHTDQLAINWEAYLLTTVVREDKENLTVFLKIYSPQVNGFVKFRDFFVDSLLFPSVFNGNIIVYADEKIIFSAPAQILGNGGYVPVEYYDTGAKIKAEFIIDQPEFSPEDYLALTNAGTLLNFYYSYSQILEQVVKRVQKDNVGRENEPSAVYITWHELNRLNNYVEHHDFAKKLNIKHSDSKQLLSNLEKSVRLERRYLTLYNLVLNAPRKSVVMDKHKFCEDFAGLSTHYLEEGGNYQPYLASGYNEMVKIFPDSIEFTNLKNTGEYYDVFKIDDDVSTPQLIYDHFIEFAQSAYSEGKDVAALDLLGNADLIVDEVDHITHSSQYMVLYTQALEALMDSYLQVAIMAYRSGNYAMANDYSSKAIAIFNQYKTELQDVTLSTDAFRKFTGQQLELAHTLLKDKKYRSAITLLDNASEIYSLKFSEPQANTLDSAYRIAYNGLYSILLDSIVNLPENRNPDDKLKSLEYARKYAEAYQKYIDFSYYSEAGEIAGNLFNSYYSDGNYLLSQAKAEDALKSLLKAKYINETYFHASDVQLDSLIYNTTVPVILGMIEKARFETWANRLNKAEEIYNQAKNLQIAYQQLDQPELVLAFEELRSLIDNRICASVQFTVNDKTKIIQNRLNAKKYSEAYSEYKKTESLLRKYDNCQLDLIDYNQLLDNNLNLFNYLNQKLYAENLLSENKFDRAIEQFLVSTGYFSLVDQEAYSISYPSLKQFVEEKNKVELTRAAAEYYISNSDFQSAFTFLTILKKQKVPAKSTKDLQQSIGEGMAKSRKNNNENKINADILTGGDEWFKYFKYAYQGFLKI